MRLLKRLGFYRELFPEYPSASSLLDAKRVVGIENEMRVSEYLKRGSPLVICPGVEFDVFNGHGPIGSGSILTDGVWAWSDTLPYYLETYHIDLPREFLEMVTAACFAPLALSIHELRKLRLQ